MRTNRITVLPYDSAWGSDFEKIKCEIEVALGELIIGIEHVGSTAVEGLSAKPCIDIDVIIKDYSVFDAVVKALENIGYIHEGDLGIKGREAFKYSDKPHLKNHHLYVCPKDSEELHRHIALRDHLRNSPLAREEYGKVKVEAARLFPNDIDKYIEYKAPCIEKMYKAIGASAPYKNILDVGTRVEFREWLSEHHATEKECYVAVKRGKPSGEDTLFYLDAVEEALCFGWIDSTARTIDGVGMQRFSPRSKKSNWTELNKERCRRLIRLGLMTEAGLAVMPDLDTPFVVDKDVECALKEARVWTKFKSLPPLYQRIRAYNLAFYKKRNPDTYTRMLRHTIEATKEGKTFGEWNDYGRLI